MSSNFDREQTIQLLRRYFRRQQQLSLLDPAEFRRQVQIPVPSGTSCLSDAIQPWQADDFMALDAGWRTLARRANSVIGSEPALQRAYIERPRGHSKTSDMAVQLTWILLAAQHPVRGLAAAADRDQANLIHEAIRRLVMANPQLCGSLDLVQHEVRNSATKARLEIISSDVAGSWGAIPDFVVCDELCHWEKPEMWYSLLSSAAKKPGCMLTVLTNAGVGRGWQWQLREHARTSPAWYFSSLDGPKAPWITANWLEEQQALLPPAVFERLWLNRWQHSDGEFVSLAEADACCDPELTCRSSGASQRTFIAAVDYAEKHDYTVGCVAHWEEGIIHVDRMDVVVPSPQAPTPVQWVEDWMLEMAQRFQPITFVVDEYQLLGVIQKLERRLNIRRFAFHSGEGNHQLAMRLRQLVIQRGVRWYPDCGRIPTADGHRDDLATELASLLLRQSGSGRIRIDHRSEANSHDDRAFALGVAVVELSHMPQEVDYLQITPPSLPGAFDW